MHKVSDIRSMCTAVKVGFLYRYCVFKGFFLSFFNTSIYSLDISLPLCALFCFCSCWKIAESQENCFALDWFGSNFIFLFAMKGIFFFFCKSKMYFWKKKNPQIFKEFWALRMWYLVAFMPLVKHLIVSHVFYSVKIKYFIIFCLFFKVTWCD